MFESRNWRCRRRFSRNTTDWTSRSTRSRAAPRLVSSVSVGLESRLFSSARNPRGTTTTATTSPRASARCDWAWLIGTSSTSLRTLRRRSPISMCRLPTEARSGRWSRSTNATRGRAPASAITAPTSTASASGYTTSSATISGERRRIRRSLASRARTARIRGPRSDAVRASRNCTNACSNAPALEPSMPARSQNSCCGSREDEAPLLQHDQPVGLHVGLLDVLRREHDGAAAARHAAQELPQPRALARVEARRRLVQEHDRGVGDEADRHVQALDVADRELLGRAVRRVDQVDRLEQPLGLGVRAREPLELGEQAQVLPRAQLAVQRGSLRHPAGALGRALDPPVASAAPPLRAASAASSCPPRSARGARRTRPRAPPARWVRAPPCGRSGGRRRAPRRARPTTPSSRGFRRNGYPLVVASAPGQLPAAYDASHDGPRYHHDPALSRLQRACLDRLVRLG